jgi:hypothetical protein
MKANLHNLSKKFNNCRRSALLNFWIIPLLKKSVSQI